MKNSKWTWGIGCILLLCVFGIGYIFFGEPSAQESASTKQEGTLVTFSGADFREEKDGELVWLLKAEKILVDSGTKDVYFTNAEAVLYKEGNSLVVHAKKAELKASTGVITLEGEVKATSPNGTTFVGEDLTFNTKENKLTSNKTFTYSDGHMTLTADTLTADTVMQQIEAKGHVKIEEKSL